MHWYSSTCNNWPWNFAAMVINIFTAFVACPIVQTMTVTHRSAGKNTIAEHIHTMLEGLHKLLLLNDWNEFYSDWQYFNWYSINMWWGPYNIRVQIIFLSPSPPHHFFDVVFIFQNSHIGILAVLFIGRSDVNCWLFIQWDKIWCTSTFYL